MDRFLPAANDEIGTKGRDILDVIIVTGDAYVDHPSFGAAVIGRVIESAGFSVGIIAQPDWRSVDDFTRLGKPRLFFGVTAGNLDSMVANYSARKKPRRKDSYSPGGRPGLRPDRTSIVYSNRIREAFGDICIVLGGIEASLRRFAHYDWWDNKVRRSLLLDTRADILVYGMGEGQVVEIAGRLDQGADLMGIRGTAIVGKEIPSPGDSIEIPSCEEVLGDKDRFNEAFRLIYTNQNPLKGKTLFQGHGNRYVIQFPPPLPLSGDELDRIYQLPYARACHPAYEKEGGIPGFETVRYSVISHRGCCGSCSFCSLSMHQGRIVQSRSAESILKEVRMVSGLKDFRGTITDVGGPTANLYKARCSLWDKGDFCETRDCLFPEKCTRLLLGYREGMGLYKTIRALPRVKHMFIESGIRYDLLVDDDSTPYFEYICEHHISGQMKVAPEHSVSHVLRIMNKPDFRVYERFVKKFKEIQKRIKKDQYLVNYFISAHPGAGLEDEETLSSYLKQRRMHPEQVQDYTPLPLTLAGCIYYTEKHPFTGEKVYVAKSLQDRKMHRALIQYGNPDNRRLIQRAAPLLKKGGPR
ncbi:MAG: YgiQ family radical SAM protein [Syntrophus sp. (in: bacteria)]|nr:YgiQ family radical SAM protein [Syntrophus sp. (in: bacteria)]